MKASSIIATSYSTNGDFAVLTARRVKNVLSAIATQSNTLSQLCSDQALVHDDDEMGNIFRSIEVLVSTIGALADRPLGDGCVGDIADWHCGPNFEARA